MQGEGKVPGTALLDVHRESGNWGGSCTCREGT